jgi:hypothetical protein
MSVNEGCEGRAGAWYDSWKDTARHASYMVRKAADHPRRKSYQSSQRNRDASGLGGSILSSE